MSAVCAIYTASSPAQREALTTFSDITRRRERYRGLGADPSRGFRTVIVFLPSDGPSFVTRWRPIKIAGAASR